MPTNNERAERQYLKEYNRLLTAVFNAENAWASALQPIQVVDGIRENASSFSVKTNNTPVVIGTYDTGADVAFGTGTGNSTRFGKRVEIKYTNTDVPFDYTIAIHEGLDKFTVNEELDFAVSERLEIQSQAQTRFMSGKIGTFLGAKAGNAVAIASLTDPLVISSFETMRAFYVNKEVSVPVTAYVTPAVYGILLATGLITTAKNSNVNIDRATLEYAFGFRIVQTPEQYFAEDEWVYFVPEGVVLPFVGISEVRAISSEDFSGTALQAAAKGGTYVSDENATVISKIAKS